jgi:intein/homing endonuclease
MKQATTYKHLQNVPKHVRIVSNRGGTRCLSPDTEIVTISGTKFISEIKVGDIVKTYNESTLQNEYKEVEQVHKLENTKKTIRVKLKNGNSITATEDHKFYYKGGWYSLKHLLSLGEPIIKEIANGNLEKNTPL